MNLDQILVQPIKILFCVHVWLRAPFSSTFPAPGVLSGRLFLWQKVVTVERLNVCLADKALHLEQTAGWKCCSTLQLKPQRQKA